jgi:hypothetical protein
LGTVSGDSIINIPSDSSVVITASLTGCSNSTKVTMPSQVCLACISPILTVGSASCSGEGCYAGGLVGTQGYDGCSDDCGSIENSFWDINTSTQTVMCGSVYGTGCTDDNGKTTAQMKLLSTFASVWDISGGKTNLNSGYPYLSWQVGQSDYNWYILDDTSS